MSLLFVVNKITFIFALLKISLIILTFIQISESFDNLQECAVSDLEKCLGSEKFTELRDFSLDVEERKENNMRICVCKVDTHVPKIDDNVIYCSIIYKVSKV